MKKTFLLLAALAVLALHFSLFFAAQEMGHEHDAEDCGICKIIFIASTVRKSLVNFSSAAFLALLFLCFALQNQRLRFLLLPKKSLVSLKVKFLN